VFFTLNPSVRHFNQSSSLSLFIRTKHASNSSLATSNRCIKTLFSLLCNLLVNCEGSVKLSGIAFLIALRSSAETPLDLSSFASCRRRNLVNSVRPSISVGQRACGESYSVMEEEVSEIICKLKAYVHNIIPCCMTARAVKTHLSPFLVIICYHPSSHQ